MHVPLVAGVQLNQTSLRAIEKHSPLCCGLVVARLVSKAKVPTPAITSAALQSSPPPRASVVGTACGLRPAVRPAGRARLRAGGWGAPAGCPAGPLSVGAAPAAGGRRPAGAAPRRAAGQVLFLWGVPWG